MYILLCLYNLLQLVEYILYYQSHFESNSEIRFGSGRQLATMRRIRLRALLVLPGFAGLHTSARTSNSASSKPFHALTLLQMTMLALAHVLRSEMLQRVAIGPLGRW